MAGWQPPQGGVYRHLSKAPTLIFSCLSIAALRNQRDAFNIMLYTAFVNFLVLYIIHIFGHTKYFQGCTPWTIPKGVALAKVVFIKVAIDPLNGTAGSLSGALLGAV